LIGFYHEDGQKLPALEEWGIVLQQETQARQHAEAEATQERQRAEHAELRAQALSERLRALGVDPDQL
jgi:uncharacterized membrane protein